MLSIINSLSLPRNQHFINRKYAPPHKTVATVLWETQRDWSHCQRGIKALRAAIDVLGSELKE